jgi:hypothetical protein
MTNAELMRADGWAVRYEEGNRLTLEREGWMACINVAADVMMIFDPTGVAVKAPDTYAWGTLQAARWYCKSCFRTADMLETLAITPHLCWPCKQDELEALR